MESIAGEFGDRPRIALGMLRFSRTKTETDMGITVPKDAIDRALDQIDREGIPPKRHSTGYCLEARNRHYPPKLVLGLAAGLKPDEHSGGDETNRILKKHYPIVECCRFGNQGLPNSN